MTSLSDSSAPWSLPTQVNEIAQAALCPSSLSGSTGEGGPLAASLRMTRSHGVLHRSVPIGRLLLWEVGMWEARRLRRRTFPPLALSPIFVSFSPCELAAA